MPITYEVSRDGHFIHAVASNNLTSRELVEYEKEHGSDKRLKPPVAELREY